MVSGCRNLVLASPILLWVRLQFVLCRLLPKGPTIRVLLVGVNNFEPGSAPLKPTLSIKLPKIVRDPL